jgi:hypothetical protein
MKLILVASLILNVLSHIPNLNSDSMFVHGFMTIFLIVSLFYLIISGDDDL